jgi:hypothetical protein
MGPYARSNVHVHEGEADMDDVMGDDDGSFPFDQFSNLQKRRQDILSLLPDSSSSTIPTIPTTCGIFNNLQLLGVFPTSRWLSDPSIHPDIKELFGGSPFHGLGEYRVSQVEMKDGAAINHNLLFIVNTGVRGMNVGYFGGIYRRFGDGDARIECIARIKNARVIEVPKFHLSRKENTEDLEDQQQRNHQRKEWFALFPEWLEFLTFEEGQTSGVVDDEESGGEEDEESPRISTQLEQLLGIATEFIIEGVDWDILHPSLIEVRDMSPRAERKRARQKQPRAPLQPIRLTFDEGPKITST